MSDPSVRHLCLNCQQADMALGTQTATARLYDLSESVNDVTGWHCPRCGEVEFTDPASAARFDAALQKLDQVGRLDKRSASTANRFAIEEIRQGVEFDEWQIGEIRSAINEADRGEFASDKEVKDFFDAYRQPPP